MVADAQDAQKARSAEINAWRVGNRLQPLRMNDAFGWINRVGRCLVHVPYALDAPVQGRGLQASPHGRGRPDWLRLPTGCVDGQGGYKHELGAGGRPTGVG